MPSRQLNLKMFVGATFLVASALLAMIGPVAARGQSSLRTSALSPGSERAIGADLRSFDAGLAHTSPATAVAQMVSEETRLDTCLPALKRFYTGIRSYPTSRQAAVNGDLALIITTGAQLDGEAWYDTSYRTFLDLEGHLSLKDGGVPPAFVAEAVTPAFDFSPCGTVESWSRHSFDLTAEPSIVTPLMRGSSLSVRALLGTLTVREGVAEWHAPAALTKRWELEVGAGIKRTADLNADANRQFQSWLVGTGLTALLAKDHFKQLYFF